MWRKWQSLLIAFLLVIGIAACATASLRNDIIAGAGLAQAYADRTRLLLEADLITVDQARARLAQIIQARQALESANSALLQCEAAGANKCDTAAIQEAAARGALLQVETWLIQQEARKKGGT